MISFCGMACLQCDGYIATKNDDDELRNKLAEEWSKMYGTSFEARDINCDGCKSGRRQFVYCKVCEVRKCCIAKGVENCGHCDVYPCENVTLIHDLSPEAKRNIEYIRRKLEEERNI